MQIEEGVFYFFGCIRLKFYQRYAEQAVAYQCQQGLGCLSPVLPQYNLDVRNVFLKCMTLICFKFGRMK